MSTTPKIQRPKRKAAPARKRDPRQLVNFYVHGTTGGSPEEDFSSAKVIEQLHAGLPYSELEALREVLDVPMERLAPMLGISKATLHRRKASQRLDTAESDRVLRFARLVGRAVEAFEDVDYARKWLTTPQYGLGFVVPLEFAETEIGTRDVDNLIGRIEYGVYS